MKSFKSLPQCLSGLTAGLLVAAALPLTAGADDAGIVFGGAGWIQAGMIGHSSDPTIGKELRHNGIYSSGAQFTLQANPSEKWEGQAALGAIWSHTLASDVNVSGGYAAPTVTPYVAQANFTYKFWNEESSVLSVRGGLFAYNYNPDVANLGLYLLRGPLYPGIVLSGFETKNVLPVANMLGIQVHHQTGNFQHDFMLTSETEFFPYFDISPIYVASYQFGPVFRLGAGVNFYHLISISDSLTSGKWTGEAVYTDPVTNKADTLSFKGTKLMVNGSLDPKPIFGGSEILGPEDLKLYFEVDLFGLNNSQAYKDIYGDMKHRMPMMAGFNLPAFKFFDKLAVEVEYYGAPFPDDLDKYNRHTAGNHETPIPVKKVAGFDYKRDDMKWSLYGAKLIQSHYRLSFQVANDHFRPGIYAGDGDNAPAGSQAVMVAPKDWYVMTKIAYFF